MGTIGDRFGDLAALFGADGEAASESGASPESTLDHRSPGDPDAGPGEVGTDGGVGTDLAASADSGPARAATSVDGSGLAEETEAAPTLEAILTQTITELNRTGLSDQGPDLDLDFTALDLSGLPLWALVAEVERFLGRKFTDEQVGTWGSPRDILRSAEESGG